jgi:hypothetical protein
LAVRVDRNQNLLISLPEVPFNAGHFLIADLDVVGFSCQDVPFDHETRHISLLSHTLDLQSIAGLVVHCLELEVYWYSLLWLLRLNHFVVIRIYAGVSRDRFVGDTFLDINFHDLQFSLCLEDGTTLEIVFVQSSDF